MKITNKKYRIVTDCFAGYEVQYKSPWFPFWLQVGGGNTHISVENAEEWLEKRLSRQRKSIIVKYLEKP